MQKRWQCKRAGGGQGTGWGELVGDGRRRHSTVDEEVAMQTREFNTSEECNLTRWCDAISEGTAMQTRACDSAGSTCNGRRGCMQWRARLEMKMKKRGREEVLLPNIPHSTPRGDHSMTQEITLPSLRSTPPTPAPSLPLVHPTATRPRTASHSDPPSAPGDPPYLGDPAGRRGQMAKPQVWGCCSWLQAAEPGLLPASCLDPGTAAPACACCTPSLGCSTRVCNRSMDMQREHGRAKVAWMCKKSMHPLLPAHCLNHGMCKAHMCLQNGCLHTSVPVHSIHITGDVCILILLCDCLCTSIIMLLCMLTHVHLCVQSCEHQYKHKPVCTHKLVHNVNSGVHSKAHLICP